MKVHHFALLFLLFFIAAVIKTDIIIGNLKAMANEKYELTKYLDSATSDAINCLAESGNHGTNSINKEKVVSTFLTSLYSSLGIISNKSAQEGIEMYIPVMLLCDEDGYYVYYYDEYKGSDGYTYAKRIWSEKQPYYYKDNYFVYRFTLTDTVYLYDVNNLLPGDQDVLEIDYHEIQKADEYQEFRSKYGDCILLKDEAFKLAKKSAIIKQLEDVMAYYTTKHNEIARRNGITYNFSFPSNKQGEWARYIDDVNLMVVFQGYPYGLGRDYTYNKVASAGADVIKKPVYYLEKKSWYYLAHKEGCPKLAESTMVTDEPLDSIEACVKMGAYCDDCIEYGARLPNLTK